MKVRIFASSNFPELFSGPVKEFDDPGLPGWALESCFHGPDDLLVAALLDENLQVIFEVGPFGWTVKGKVPQHLLVQAMGKGAEFLKDTVSR